MYLRGKRLAESRFHLYATHITLQNSFLQTRLTDILLSPCLIFGPCLYTRDEGWHEENSTGPKGYGDRLMASFLKSNKHIPGIKATTWLHVPSFCQCCFLRACELQTSMWPPLPRKRVIGNVTGCYHRKRQPTECTQAIFCPTAYARNWSEQPWYWSCLSPSSALFSVTFGRREQRSVARVGEYKLAFIILTVNQWFEGSVGLTADLSSHILPKSYMGYDKHQYSEVIHYPHFKLWDIHLSINF